MKVDIYLVKDEYSTIANFTTANKAMEYAAKNEKLTVERIEIEAPKWKHIKTVSVEIPVSNTDEMTSYKMDDVINAHILNVYNRTNRNKSQTSRIVGLTYKTILKRLKDMGEL